MEKVKDIFEKTLIPEEIILNIEALLNIDINI